MKDGEAVISKQSFLFTILILPFLQPLIFNEYENIDKIYMMCKLISSFAILVLFCLKFFKGKVKVSKFLIITFAYLLILLLSTILNKASINRCLSYILPIFSLYLLSEMWIEFNMKNFLKVLGNILSIYIVINFITVIFIPMFMQKANLEASRYFFLGEDNRFIFVMLPLISILGLNDYLYIGKISRKTKFIYLICLITLIYRWSVGAMVSLFLFGVLNVLLIRYKNNMLKFFNIKFVYGLFIFIYISIVIFNLHYQLLDLFEIWFNKRQTVESRYMLWEWCFKYIENKPLLGYGIEEILILKSKFLVNHCHNMFFQITYETGYIGLITYIMLFYVLGRKIKICKNENISKYSTIIIFIMLILGLFDTLNHSYLFLMMFIIYSVTKYSDNIKIKDVEQELWRNNEQKSFSNSTSL